MNNAIITIPDDDYECVVVSPHNNSVGTDYECVNDTPPTGNETDNECAIVPPPD